MSPEDLAYREAARARERAHTHTRPVSNPNATAEWRAANPEKVRAAAQRWREKSRPPKPPCAVCGAQVPEARAKSCVDCRVEYKRICRRRWREANPEKQPAVDVWATRLKYAYGLTPAAWHALLLAQSGRCAICTVPMQNPNVDHCHATGRVRGLLCVSCNTALGKLGDSVDGLRRALEYLTSSQPEETECPAP